MANERTGRIKVLHIITRFILGGAQENTLLTVFGLRDSPRYEPLLATGPAEGPEGSLLDRARSSGIVPIIIPELVREISPFTDYAALKVLRALIRKTKPVIVHTHSSKAGILGREAAWREHVPIIVHTIHGPPFHAREKFWKNTLYTWLERREAKRSSVLISVADAMTRQYLDRRIGRLEQYVTIRSGMEIEPFLKPYDKALVRKRLSIPQNAFVIAKIARIAPLKGHEDLLKAVSQVRRTHPEAHLLLIGDGELRSQITSLASNLGLSDSLTFTGLVPPSDIPELLGAADCLVHASYREGLPRAVVQAMLSGLPVAAYALDGTPEVVEDGKTGFLVPAGDISALAAAITGIISDPAAASAMGAAGRRRVSGEFSWITMVQRIEALYDRLLDSCPSMCHT
jgi:glycosyltransferase involved in cell wall biosynthesis